MPRRTKTAIPSQKSEAVCVGDAIGFKTTAIDHPAIPPRRNLAESARSPKNSALAGPVSPQG
jgi:hypothetical protein